MAERASLPDQGGAVRHRPFVDSNETGYWAMCPCGWRERYTSPVAARREARAHRRYPDGNPRIAALKATSDEKSAS